MRTLGISLWMPLSLLPEQQLKGVTRTLETEMPLHRSTPLLTACSAFFGDHSTKKRSQAAALGRQYVWLSPNMLGAGGAAGASIHHLRRRALTIAGAGHWGLSAAEP